MPANTSPDNIIYPISTDNIAPLETVFATMASSVQDALDGVTEVRAVRTYKWADATERGLQVGMTEGDTGFQLDSEENYQYISGSWQLATSGPYAEAHGTATTTAVGGSGGSAPFYWGGYETATFPAGRFTLPPIVTVSPLAIDASIYPGVQIGTVTSSSFQYRLFRIGAAPVSGSKISWSATQSTELASAG